MLSLETYGYGYSINRAENIVNWFIDTYLPRHKITVDINHRGMKREGVIGWISVVDSDSRPRWFDIELQSNLDAETYTKTLLHELWHLLQHVRGILKDKGSKRYWRGTDCSLMDYMDQPWEIQAREMEEILYEEYLTHH